MGSLKTWKGKSRNKMLLTYSLEIAKFIDDAYGQLADIQDITTWQKINVRNRKATITGDTRENVIVANLFRKFQTFLHNKYNKEQR